MRWAGIQPSHNKDRPYEPAATASNRTHYALAGTLARMAAPTRPSRARRIRWWWFIPSVAILLWTVPSLNRTVGWQTGTASGKPFTVFAGYGTLVISWGHGKWARTGDATFGSYTTDGFTFWNLGKLRAFWWRPRFLGDQLYIPFWLIALLLAAPPALIEYRRITRRPTGSCTSCGYDRTGLASDAKCPECGGTRISNL